MKQGLSTYIFKFCCSSKYSRGPYVMKVWNDFRGSEIELLEADVERANQVVSEYCSSCKSLNFFYDCFCNQNLVPKTTYTRYRFRQRFLLFGTPLRSWNNTKCFRKRLCGRSLIFLDTFRELYLLNAKWNRWMSIWTKWNQNFRWIMHKTKQYTYISSVEWWMRYTSEWGFDNNGWSSKVLDEFGQSRVKI